MCGNFHTGEGAGHKDYKIKVHLHDLSQLLTP